MKTNRPWIIAVSLFLISPQSYGQEEENKISGITRQGKLYEYNDSIYKRNELRKVIYTSRNAEAIRIVEQARRLNISGNVFLITGGVLVVSGFARYITDQTIEHFTWNDDEISKAGLVMAGVGTGMVVLGGILKGSGNSALRKSINRFNTMRIGNQDVRLNVVPLYDTIGLGLTWRIGN